MNISSLLNKEMLKISSNGLKEDGMKSDNVKNSELSNEYKKVAEEMESLFAYQLLKTMRETASSMSDSNKSSGHDTYMSMFDMEISKLFAKRGMGLQESIISWLERMPATSTSMDKSVENN